MKWCVKVIAIFLLAVAFAMPCWASQLSAQDQAAIYRLVLLRLIGPDDTYGGHLHPKKIYVSEILFVPPVAKEMLHFFDLTEHEPPLPPPELPVSTVGSPTSIVKDVKGLLTNKLNSEGWHIWWVKNDDSAPIRSSDCGNPGSPLVVAFSTLQELPNNNVFVQGSINCGPVFGTTFYLLAKFADGWRIVRVMPGPIS